MITRRFTMATIAALTVATLAREPVGAQTPRPVRGAPAQPMSSGLRFGFAGGLSIPAGDLGNSTSTGFAIAVRGETPLSAARWSARADLSFDRFDGRGIVNAYTYTALAASLVHHDGDDRMYQYGGLGVYNSRTAFVGASDLSSTDLGVQAGLGYDFRTTAPRWFLEAGLASAFTSGRSSLWFPVRVGFWF